MSNKKKNSVYLPLACDGDRIESVSPSLKPLIIHFGEYKLKLRPGQTLFYKHHKKQITIQ